jgi:hypothetical protein
MQREELEQRVPRGNDGPGGAMIFTSSALGS